MTTDPFTVHQQDDWTILHMRSGGAETTTSLTWDQVRRLSGLLTSPDAPEGTVETDAFDWNTVHPMIEPMAKAICGARGKDPDRLILLHGKTPRAQWRNYTHAAKVAIDLMEGEAP